MLATAPPGGKGKAARPYHQRCAVRVTYLNNKTRGQWKAHGRYLARESATFENDAKAVGFSRESDAIDIAGQLESWQAAGDEQFWKLIVSPEFGDRVDLSRLTRGLIEHMENDLGTALEWVAVDHHNTEHPHVHVVVRGVRDDGEALRLRRRIRAARDSGNCWQTYARANSGIGRSSTGSEAERREVTEKRFTSIDKQTPEGRAGIGSDAGSQYFAVTRNPLQTGLDRDGPTSHTT